MLRSTFIFCCFLLSNLMFSQQMISDTSTVALVNNDPITLQELKLCEQKVKSKVLVNSIEIKSEQSTPEILKKKALDEAVRIKIQQQLALQLGLVTDIHYSSFLTDLNAENLRRKNALENNELIYGPAQFLEENYINYRFSQLVILLKTEFKNRISLSDDELLQMYASSKDSLYKLSDYIQVLELTIPLAEDCKYSTKLISMIKNKLSGDKHNFSDSISLKNGDFVLIEPKTFDPTKYQPEEGEEQAEVLKQLENVDVGNFSPEKISNGKYQFYKLLKRKPMGYKSFQSVKNDLTNNYVNFLYANYLENLRKNAIIVQY